MSYVDEFNKALTKNTKSLSRSDRVTTNPNKKKRSYEEELQIALDEALAKQKLRNPDLSNGTIRDDVDTRGNFYSYDNDQEGDATWFQKGAFSDGIDSVGDFFASLGKTAIGTLADVSENMWTGTLELGEAAIDSVAYGVGTVGGLFSDDFRDDVDSFIAKEILAPQQTGEIMSKMSIVGALNEWVNDGNTEENSVLGDKADGLVQSGTQYAEAALLQTVGVPMEVTMGVNAFGSELESAFQNDATHLEAGISASVSAAAEIIFEKISGFVSFGGRALDDSVQNWIKTNISNKLAKTITKYVVGAVGEGTEEVLTEAASAVGRKITYLSEKEWGEVLSSEDLFDAFIGGAALSGIIEGGRVINSKLEGRGFISGLTQSEQSVVDKLYNDALAEAEKNGKTLTKKQQSELYDTILDNLEHGQISIDDIESVLGGDAYKSYRETVDSEEALKTELKELREMEGGKRNDFQETRMQELKGMNLEDTTKRDALRQQLDDVLSPLLQDSKLAESYRERARRGEAFQVDLSQYTGKQREAVERAVNSGVLNNTYQAHRLVETLSKIEAEKGIVFNYADNARLKESGFALDGRTVNGFVNTNNGEVTLNIQSAKAWQSVVGHEITHILQDNTTAYEDLQKALFAYAESRGELQSRRAALTKLYNGISEDVDAELTADLVGDYLFTDSGFIKNLTGNKNLFQKIYNEIKYLFNVATGKQRTEIEKVKREFDKAWKELSVATKSTDGDNVRLSVSEGSDKGVRTPEEIKIGIDTADFIESVSKMLDQSKISKRKFKIGAISEAHREIIEEIMQEINPGFSANDYELWIDGTGAEHINARHGENGKADHTMASREDRELIPWAANTPDGGELIRDDFGNVKLSNRYFNADGSKAPQIRLHKEVGGDIVYVSECVPDARNKRIYITSAYKKSSTNQLLNIDSIESPQPTPEATFDSGATNDILSPSPKNVKFSLSESVEETKDLVALHNLTADKLTKSLELGGLPMPSLAITKADIPHDNFGEITLIFDKKTIDPKANKKNKVYSADAWTPTFPRVEYEADSKVVDRVSQKLSELGKMVDTEFQNDLSRIGYSIEDYLNSMGGEEGLIRHIMDNYGLKAAYLESIGKHIGKITQQQEVPRGFNPASADKYNRVMEILGVNTAEEIYEVDLKDARDNHGAELEEVFPGITKSALRMGKVLGSVGSYLKGKDSAPEYKTVTDIGAMREAVDDALDSEGFEAWVRNLFSGVVKDSGIYNNKDLFTPSGNRRSFKQTHLPVTLENIVKAMASQNDGNAKNVSSFNGVKTLRASTAETFRSIDEMHQRKDRLQHLTQEQADEITEGLQNRLFAVMEAIDNENSQQGDRNIYIRYDQIGETIAEIGESGKYDVADIQDTFSQYGRTISDETAQAIKQLLYDVTQMPVNIFEAKPQRVVSFDEAKVFVVPNNIDVKLKQELLNRGYSIAEYDPNVEGDRLRVVSQFEEYKFSLSNVGEQPSTVGTPLQDLYFGKDIAPTEDIAPTQEATPTPIAPVVEDAPIAETELPFPDEIAPMTEEEANAIQDEKAKSDAEAEGQPKSRKQLHNGIIDNIRSVFSSKGFDFDTVLRRAKNLSTFRTVDNTPQRVMEKALGYKEGQVLADLTVNRVAQNETEGIKWLNSFTDRRIGLLAQISRQYSIKPGSKESAAAQMYAEGFYVNENNEIVAYGDTELAQDFPNATVRNNIKGLARDPRIRQIYDETLAAINESRARNAYPEIKPLDNYFLHFRAMDDTFSRLGLPFNPNDIRAKDLPTDLNGVTADLKPGQPYFASAMHRKGKRTSFDLLGGLERYLTSAKNQIYHIDDIQTLRALRNYIAYNYGQASGLEGIDSLSEEEAQERIEQVYGSHLSTFAKFLNEEANVLAGKTALIDRGLEGIIGRRGITFINTLNRQVGSNMVGYNVSSSLTNFIPVAQTFAKSNKFDFIKAFAQTVSNKFGSIVGKSDGFAEKSPVIIRRKGADRFYRTPFQKVADTGYFLMSAVDNISTELIARTKFNELTRNGMSEQQAHFETDKWVSRLMGDRSLGQMPQLYNSKMLGLITKFQLEVRNQLDSQFYDTIQEARVSNEDIENGLARNAKTAAKVASTFVQLAVVQHLFGKAFESIAGYNPAFDIIEVLSTALGFDDDDDSEDTALDNIEQGFVELLEDLPYTSIFTGGGRIPISSALPISDLIMGEDEYGNEKSRLETLGEVAPYYFLPGGYGQLKKTAQGLGMFSDELPVAGSYTDSGNLRFPVEDTLANRIQAGIFGQYANDNASEYFDNGYAPLKENQIQEYIDVEMPIKDYWEYRQGLAKQETLEDKFDYIAGLDLTVEQKNILINNVVNRKEEVDLENYDDFSSLEEFDYATKNPDKYAVSKAVGGYSSYKTYSEALYDIKADKDENGKTINGSRKEKVIAWLNELDADYETKIILFKSEYPADDTYNQEIIDYINSRDDLTYDERIAIYTELGFTVKDGYVYWD